MSKKELTLEIIIAGNDCVGKTSLISRFVENEFSDKFEPTKSYYFKSKIFDVDDHKVKLEIWDAVLQEKFHSFARAYKRGVDGILVVFDVTNENSFEGIQNWIELIQKECPRAVVALVANKCDINDRKVTKENAEQYAAKYGLKYFETSAKNNEGLQEVFNYVAKQSYLNLI